MFKISTYILLVIGCLVLFYFILNATRIYRFSSEFSEKRSDVAIILGAGTKDGKISPIFRERIIHGINLYKRRIVGKLIFTGGLGEDQQSSDSECARTYAISKGIPKQDIIIEERSGNTYENLIESKRLMDSLNLRSALIVSDPLHMKRSIDLAKELELSCDPSPTPTSMYKSRKTKLRSLISEAYYYCLGQLVGRI